MRELVILDLDGVIVDGQSQKIFLKYLLEKRLIKIFFYFRMYFWFILYKLGLTRNPEKVMIFAYSFLGGKTTEEIDEIVNAFFIKNLKKFIFPEIIDIINEHIKKGRELLIVSNSVDIIVRKVADFLQIKNYICTNLEIINGKYTGKILGGIIYGKNKIDSINNFINNKGLNIKNTFVYTDHISDLPLLLIVKNPCVVNPDRLLFSEAKKRNWPILKFKHIK